MKKIFFNPKFYLPVYTAIHVILIIYYFIQQSNFSLVDKIFLSLIIVLDFGINCIFLHISSSVYDNYQTKNKIKIIIFTIAAINIFSLFILPIKFCVPCVSLFECIACLAFAWILFILGSVVESKSIRLKNVFCGFGIFLPAVMTMLAVINLYIQII